MSAIQPLTPLPFQAVTINDRFWSSRQRANSQRTLAIEYDQCQATGRIDAFKLAWQPGQTPVPHIFWDSDVAKWIEAASYSLSTDPDPDLESLLDQVIDLIAAAQQPDGYLNTHFIQVEPDKRFTNLRDWHELYCAGHLIEAAVAHFQATGKRSLLEVMCRYADFIGSVFGLKAGQLPGYDGHEEIELALIKLFHATGETRYLDLSKYFVEQRGQRPYFFDQEAVARGDDPAKFWAKTYAYNQSHIPVREQREVVGHAVRAMYLYTAMADLVAETGDTSLLPALEHLWDNLTHHQMYITGGIGPSRHNEGFTSLYDLPNETAYAETCAAVGLVFWAHRMLRLNCDRRYADVLERALYNGTICGVSLNGEHFFYENPLASLGSHHRQAWFDCACCPPNIARLIASIGQYIYAQTEQDLIVHLYVQGSGRFQFSGQPVILHQKTEYPWEGRVSIEVELAAGTLPEQPVAFGLKLRMPGWCRRLQVKLNGQPLAVGPLELGYVRIGSRNWQSGDRVELDMEMPVERVYGHPNVRQDVGRTALQRGPVVYCVEAIDHEVPVEHLVLPIGSELETRFEPGLLDGVVVIEGEALVIDAGDWEGQLYRIQPPSYRPATLRAIPYYAWDNRAPGAMTVWLPEVGAGC
jgi:DUF1680 family protein